MPSSPPNQAITGRRRWPGQLPGFVAAFTPLLVVAALGALWARSARLQDRYVWERKDSRFDPVAGRAWIFSDEVQFESGSGVAGLRWHRFRAGSRLKPTPGDFDAIASVWRNGTTLRRKEVEPWDLVNINSNDALFHRHPDEVGPWRVFHWEYQLHEIKDGGLMGGPEGHVYGEFAAPYWLLMAPCLLPLAWWLACPAGRALPRLTLRRLAALTVVAALGCWALTAFARSSARDRALSTVSELGGLFTFERVGTSPVIKELYFNYDIEPGNIDDAAASRLRAALALLPRLKSVTSFSKTLTGPRLAFLADQTDLESVGIHESVVDDEALSFLRGARTLKFLSADGTGLTDAGLAHLKGLDSLEALHIRGQPITDAGLAHLEGLPRLWMIDMTDRRPSGPEAKPRSTVTPEAVRRLFKATPSLSQFDFPDGRRMEREK